MDKINNRADALDVFNQIQVARANASEALNQYRKYLVDTELANGWLATYQVSCRAEETFTRLLREWLEG